MTTSKPVRRFATAFLIAVAIAFQCVGRQGIAIGGSWRMDWAQEYGWPWVSLSMLFTSQGSMLGGRFTTAYELPDTVHWWWTSASGIFVLPLLGNIAWWAALILLVHRALTPSPDSGSKEGVPLRWSVRGLLLLQLLAALAIGLGDRW